MQANKLSQEERALKDPVKATRREAKCIFFFLYKIGPLRILKMEKVTHKVIR